MKNLIAVVTVLCSCLGFAAAQDRPAGARRPATPVGPEALWQPGMGIMQAMREGCDKAPDFGQCFVSMMQKSGASAQAVAFARLTGNTGYMRDFREAGRVDVAYVNYPFRANENQGCLLVNGDPPAIDVDDVSALPQNDLQRDARYAALANKYPNVTIFPGDRAGTSYPEIKSLPGGGQRFIFGYRLVNGCRACERVGAISFAFDFDRAGKFLGPKIVSVSEASQK